MKYVMRVPAYLFVVAAVGFLPKLDTDLAIIIDREKANDPGGEQNGVMGGLSWSEGFFLSGHVSHDQWDGGQMAGTQQDADHAP